MTSGQPGELAVFLALAMTLLSGAAFFMSALGRKEFYDLGVRAYKMLIVFASLGTVWLFYLFLTHDFSIDYVYSYSSSDLPLHFVFSAFWAGQEGTYLLWFLLSGIFGLLIIKHGRQYKYWGMSFYTIVNLFLLVMLMVASPFKMIEGVAPPEGNGLNPLLQDFWMVIHPPMMFVAYAIAAVPFALVLAAFVKKDYSDWLKISFPIVGITSFLLLASNAMGGYWAYKTLGWGGYWAWDPVENTSFVPWVISIALIHGMLIEKKMGAFRRSNLLMTLSVFLLVVYGTFLTRSGVLADFSVHSFVDLGTNAVLISFIVSFLVITLGLFFFRRSSDMIGKPFSYNIFSREFVLFAGMFLLFVLSAIVLFWSSLPLLTKYISENPAAAEIATYNSFALPLAIIICLFLTVAPFLSFGNGSNEKIKNPVLAGGIGLIAAVAAFAFGNVVFAIAVTIFVYVTVILIYLFNNTLRRHIIIALIYGVVGALVAFILGVRSIANLFFFGAALTASGAFVGTLIQKIPKSFGKTAAQMAHFGTGIMLVGILASSYYSAGERIVLPRDVGKTAFDYEFVYHGSTGSVMDHMNEILLTMTGDDGVMVDARPQFYYSEQSNGYMKKPYIKKELLYDYYLAPLDIQEFPDSSRIMLAKDSTAEVSGIKVKFIDFEMGAHGEGGSISIAVSLECEYEDTKVSVKPMFFSGADGMFGQPLKIFEDQPFEVKVEKILASDGAVILSFPGTSQSGPVDQLILDVAIKPGINLLWLAIIVICFAMILSIWRRYHWLKA